MKLAWGAHVSPVFRDKIVNIAAAIGCNPSWLMACMAFETGGTFSPSIRNAAGSGATGLIQFMPSTAVGLGTTVDELAQKSAEDQLDDVFRYFARYSGRLHDLADTYMAILYPAAIGLFDSAAIFPAGSKALLMNRGLDLNHDNEVTKAEAASFVTKRLAEGLQDGNSFETAGDHDVQPAAPIEDRSTPLPQPEKPMGALLIPLLMSVVGKFLNPTVAQNVTSIVTKDGQQSTAAQSLLNTLLGAVASQAGTTPAAMQADDRAAIAATAAVQADTAKMQAVEDSAAKHLNAVMPFVQQLAVLDQMRYDAEIKGKQTVSTIAIEEHKAGLWDMTKTLVYFGAGAFLLLIFALLGALVYQSVAKGEIDQGLLGLSGPILMAGVTAWTARIAYRFDGTKESHATMEAQRATERYREETGK